MPPGVRISKRVRAGAPTEMPPGVSTRSAKRQLIAEQGKGNGHEELPPETENNGDEDVGSGHLLQDNDVNRPPSPVMDWSYGHDANHEEHLHSKPILMLKYLYEEAQENQGHQLQE